VVFFLSILARGMSQIWLKVNQQIRNLIKGYPSFVPGCLLQQETHCLNMATSEFFFPQNMANLKTIKTPFHRILHRILFVTAASL
jgi:hypothetical protein